MARKRLKQYLTLLLAIGVVALVASGGGGTFASFSAETVNPGNYFATGSLILNDNGGSQTCTSAVNGSNQNSSGTDCDTLFKLSGGAGSSFTYAKATTTTAAVNSSSTSISLSAPTGANIYKGDTLLLSNGTTTDTVTATSALSAGSAGSVTISGAAGLGAHTYAIGSSVTDNSPTVFAKLTLQNAGSLDASGISFKSSANCTDAYGGGNTTLNMGTVSAGASSGTTLTLVSTAGFNAGEPLLVSQGGHVQTFIVSSITNGTQLVVTQAQNWNFAYTVAATVTGPRLNGASPQALCANLKLSIAETNSTQATDLSGAQGCAYTVTNTNPVAANACDFSGGVQLSALPSALTSLSLASGASGNTGTQLTHDQSRYFVLAIHYVGSNFDNTYQNIKTTTFDLTWHIDQA